MERQRQLEDVNQRLIAKANEIRHQLHNRILPTDDEYRMLKATDIHSEPLSLKDFIMVRSLALSALDTARDACVDHLDALL